MYTIKTYQEALDKIFVVEETRDYSLEKVRKAMMLLWNPLKNIKVIHITGTNWKGSTSKMCFSVLKHAWKKVGCFTSPHLIDIKERFITDEWEITEEEFISCLNEILALDLSLSFFEKATLMSFLFFKKREVEYAIVEVWFWWLLDSTNVVEPLITAITSIWLDHVAFLWSTLEEVSLHKAWIIKEWIPIVYNHNNTVISKTAEEKNAETIFTKKLVGTNLLWDYQKKNAAIAFEICKYLWVDDECIKVWLQKVEHFWRLQYITDNLIIDWAHNEQWLVSLKKYIDSVKNDFDKIELCFAQKRWKNAEKILEVFWEEYNNFVLIDSDNYRMVERPDILKERIYNDFPEFNKIMFEKSTQDEVFEKSLANNNVLYVVFWSLYMIWEFLKFVWK